MAQGTMGDRSTMAWAQPRLLAAQAGVWLER